MWAVDFKTVIKSNNHFNQMSRSYSLKMSKFNFNMMKKTSNHRNLISNSKCGKFASRLRNQDLAWDSGFDVLLLALVVGLDKPWTKAVRCPASRFNEQNFLSFVHTLEMPETRSSKDTAGSKRQQQSLSNVSQKKASYTSCTLRGLA